ncbi:hypothetical protein BLOT_002309, partial [Blomia tropicalis]
MEVLYEKYFNSILKSNKFGNNVSLNINLRGLFKTSNKYKLLASLVILRPLNSSMIVFSNEK